MTEKEKQFNQWFDEYADEVKVFEEADMKQAYLQGRADLEQENIELKTKKIPQLERRIASIRGSHSVDAKKLNARIEQVERLKKENAELSMKRKAERKIFQGIVEKKNDQLTKAKEIIKDLLGSENTSCEEEMFFEIRQKAEQFLNSEVEK